MNVPDPLERPTITVEETAAMLDVGRSVAYASARAFLRGDDGIPAIRVGPRRILVPTAALRAWLGIDPPLADTTPALSIVRGR